MLLYLRPAPDGGVCEHGSVAPPFHCWGRCAAALCCCAVCVFDRRGRCVATLLCCSVCLAAGGAVPGCTALQCVCLAAGGAVAVTERGLAVTVEAGQRHGAKLAVSQAATVLAAHLAPDAPSPILLAVLTFPQHSWTNSCRLPRVREFESIPRRSFPPAVQRSSPATEAPLGGPYLPGQLAGGLAGCSGLLRGE